MAERLEASPPNFTDADADALLGSLAPVPDSISLLPLPLCLPQIVTGYDSPFLRAYNQELVSAGVEQDDWLKFIDGLNVAIAASPPLRVVDMAGFIIGFVPYHWAIIAGVVIQTTAQTAMHVLSKTLTDRYLRKANSAYFEPRGLKVRLMKTAAMRKFIHIDVDDGHGPSKAAQIAKSAGRALESTALRLPIPFLGRVLDLVNASPKVDPYAAGDATQRRLTALEGYALPPSTQGVPPPRTPEGLLDQASALAVKLRQWTTKRAESKASRTRRLLASAEGGGQALTRRQRRRERRGHPAGGRLRTRRLRGKVAKADRLEYIATDGLVWLVLFNAQDDVKIEGRQIADSAADVEQIDKDEWEDQLDLEDEEEEEFLAGKGVGED